MDSREEALKLAGAAGLLPDPDVGPEVPGIPELDMQGKPFTAGVMASDDARRMDWLEQAYTDGARDPKAWREFMTRVAEVGFRTAIDGVSVPDGKTK